MSASVGSPTGADASSVDVAIERQQGTVGDLPRQDWSLRLTLVFHRDGDNWRLLHRHADPLTRPITNEHFAEMRGESMPRAQSQSRQSATADAAC